MRSHPSPSTESMVLARGFIELSPAILDRVTAIVLRDQSVDRSMIRLPKEEERKAYDLAIQIRSLADDFDFLADELKRWCDRNSNNEAQSDDTDVAAASESSSRADLKHEQKVNDQKIVPFDPGTSETHRLQTIMRQHDASVSTAIRRRLIQNSLKEPERIILGAYLLRQILPPMAQSQFISTSDVNEVLTDLSGDLKLKNAAVNLTKLAGGTRPCVVLDERQEGSTQELRFFLTGAGEFRASNLIAGIQLSAAG